jgi:fucose permease
MPATENSAGRLFLPRAFSAPYPFPYATLRTIVTTQKRGLFLNNGFMAMHGVASVMIGTTLPEMIRSFDLSLSQGGLIVSAQSAGGLLAMFAGLVLADRVRKPAGILISVVLAGLLLGLAGLSPVYWLLVAVFFVLGIVAQILDLLLNAHTGDIMPHARTRTLNVLHMLYGIGAFVGPTLARWLLDKSLSWNSVYWIVGGAYLAVALVSLVWVREYVALVRGVTDSDDPTGAEPSDADRPAATSRQWGSVVLLGMVVLFYAIHQLGTTSWLPMYLQSSVGVSPSVASFGLSLYWVGIIVSRYITARFGSRIGETRVLVLGSILGGIVLVGSMLVGTPVITIVGFTLAGVLTGATIPLTMALAYAHVPGRTGSVTAVIYGLMMVGRLVGPWSIGSVGDEFGLDVGVIMASAVLFLVALAAFLVVLRDHRKAKPAGKVS